MPALSATVDSIAGAVSINRGDGYVRIFNSTTANVGDKVMAGAGASATVVYSAGCSVQVATGAVVTVQAEPPCVGGLTQGVDPAVVLGGVVVAGAIVGAVILLSPASP